MKIYNSHKIGESELIRSNFINKDFNKIDLPLNSFSPVELQTYVTSKGYSPFHRWLINIKDPMTAGRIAVRLDRLSHQAMVLTKKLDKKIGPPTGVADKGDQISPF